MKDCNCKEPEPSAFDLWFYYHVVDPFILQPIVIPIILRLTRFLTWLNKTLS